MTLFRKILLFLFLAITAFSCKDEPVFVDPAFIFMKWGDAVKNMNYRDYAECEAYPKDVNVFNTLYRNYYFSDFLISEIGEYNKENLKTDAEGRNFNYRIIYFECLRIDRKSGEPVENMKGDIEFIKYTEKPHSDRGWLMSNRTIVRIEVDK